ncbi:MULTISPECIES: Gfo/Idh/MocA family oxidoreductase [unclassified Streptomyces]|nr:Gfo/Idh/MocA family oxidoreductase [Streptomyces sp. SID335]MYZ17027.1 Gfo/Idh/MocA family oxidoreductase [Streptomyces sp. SID337]NDZ88486.1 Gfo/Idh/MocA family oxidoreductase [Streptomyces sp. SID10115]NEA06473.1 Gfo/Idh/MocA family oxidoreductase [Streptomyces sp. SID10116]NEB47919.1 Gfo/Idh/MocA family oxidoreductase [Streptomyces sp. SID339]
MTDLRLGVLGYGLRGSLARTAHRPDAGARVTALADHDATARAEAAVAFPGALISSDHREVVEDPDVDAVVVLTPDHTHARLACEALRAGKPVFVEKPLGTSVEACDEILRTAHETGTRLYVGHNMRHMPVVRLMRDIIERGEIGAVKTVWVRHFVGYGGDWYFKDWHAERRHTTGLLLQKAAHDIDVLHWLAGGCTRQVQALGDLMVYGDNPHRREPGEPKTDDWYTKDGHWPPHTQRDLNPVIDVEDVSLVNMRLDNGVLAAYQQCHFTPDYWRNYTVIGDAGRLENFGDGPGGVVKVWNARRSGHRGAADAEYAVPDVQDEGGHGGADPLLVDEFVRFVREGGRTDTSPVAARMAVAAGERATQSLRDGGTPREVPSPDPELTAYFERGQTR